MHRQCHKSSKPKAHFIGLQSTSDRTEPEEDSPVYTTREDKFRVYRFPWRHGSLFPSKHSGVAIAIRENTFLSANVRRIYTPPAPVAGRGGALKLVRGDAAFFDHEPVPAAVPIESARETTQREDMEVFWTKHRRASCQPKLHGQSRPVSTAPRRPHSVCLSTSAYIRNA